ncbi:MAG: hypothetical protein QM639_04370 [Rhodocyclaceae bacterium]
MGAMVRVAGDVVCIDLERLALERLVRLQVLLEDWAVWCEGFQEDLGYRRRVAGMVSGGSDTQRSEDNESAYVGRRCELVDAAIDDLPPAQRIAIHVRYGLMASVVRYPRDNHVQLLDEAHQALIRALRRKGVDI